MLAKFVNIFASRPKQSIALWIALIVFGALSFSVFLPREGFPPVDVPVAVAAGGFFVDDQELVDSQVTVPIADAALAAAEVEGVTSFSRDSSFSVIAALESGVTSAEGAAVLDGIIADLDLPPDAVIFTQSLDASKFLSEYDLLIGVFGGVDTTGEELEAAANAFVGEIDHPDIASAAVEDLFERGINPATGEEVSLQTSFNQLTNEENIFRPSIAIGVIANPDVDSIAIRDATEIALADASPALPDGFNAIIAIDGARIVEMQLSSLQSNVLLGVIVVAIVALLAISWRASIITALFIFTVLTVSAGALFIVGITLNTISLFALILALGLFVDDAIVITESIDAFREESDAEGDEGHLTVIKRAIDRVGAASLSGTVTTVLVFAPMLLIGGILGGFIRILPITIILSLLISLTLSLIFIPVAARFITLPAPKAGGPLIRAEEWVADKVAALPAVRGPKGMLIGALGVALSLVMFGIGIFGFLPNVGFNIFPPANDSTALSLEITYEPGTPIIEARQIALEVNQEAAAILGDELVQGYVFIGSEQSLTAQYEVTPIGGRPTVPELVETLIPLAESRTDARVVFSAVSNGPPEALFPFTVQVFDDDIEVLASAGEALRADLDGRELELGNGDTFNVIETDLALDDVIARDDGERFVEVRARFDNSQVTSVLDSTQTFFEGAYGAQELTDLGLSEDALGFDFGMETDNQEAFAGLAIAFPVAMLALVLLLIIQFRSSVQWILVILAIPFSFFGLFGGLLVTDNPLSFFVMLGVLGLVGIAVNNTILLVDFANQERDLGADRKDAISSAIRRRFRPLVATSLTTVGGLLPLALSDPFWEPLAFTIIFGLLSSTFLVLFAFPYYYLGIEELRDKIQTPWRRGRKKRKAEAQGVRTEEPGGEQVAGAEVLV